MDEKESSIISDESDIKNLEEEMTAMDIHSDEVVNILLVGDTGVGKSTFINAFANYLHYSDLKIAMENNLITVIPTKFTIMDENFEETVIKIDGDDSRPGDDFETNCCKSYVFPIRQGNLKICFIDTPGIADTRGINYITNLENILSFISDKQLNAICVFLKPNVSRLTVELEYSIKQLTSRLDKSACKNLVFVFTNTRSTFYRPGETLPTLRKLFEGLPNVTIPLSKDNTFCMDNEGFRFLAQSEHGIEFDPKSIKGFSKSWKNSSREFCRMINYIVGGGPNNNTPLEPVKIDNIISINKARHLILQLSKPLADITQLIQDNIALLHNHSASLISSSNNLIELKTKLNIPFINSIVTILDNPSTVCTSPDCCEVYEVNNEQKWNYKQRCHDSCSLSSVPKEIIGPPELMHCAAMGAEYICNHCKCSYEKHMHIYYETKIFQDEIVDLEVQKKIEDEEMVTTIAQDLIDKTKRRIEEYENERNIILKAAAKFAYFIQENTETSAYNDAYRSYLLFLIDREKCMDNRTDLTTILKYTKTLEQYEEEKQILSNAFKEAELETHTITANDIMCDVSVLYNLRHSGHKIKELITSKSSTPNKESTNENNEYIYDPHRNIKSRSISSLDFSDNERLINDINQLQNTSENCNQHCDNQKATNTCQNSSFHIPNKCQHTHNQGCSARLIHENIVPVGKNIFFHFNFYEGVPHSCTLEKNHCQ